jgi:hypothetical protein
MTCGDQTVYDSSLAGEKRRGNPAHMVRYYGLLRRYAPASDEGGAGRRLAFGKL